VAKPRESISHSIWEGHKLKIRSFIAERKKSFTVGSALACLLVLGTIVAVVAQPPQSGTAKYASLLPLTSRSVVVVDGLTGATVLTLDGAGQLDTTVRLVSPDQVMTLDIAAGTALTIDGTPITRLTAGEFLASPPPPPDRTMIIARNLGPEGARASHLITMILKFDPTALPPRLVPQQDLTMALWDGALWTILDSTVNPLAGTVSAQVQTLGGLAILARIVAEVPPAAPPTPPAPLAPALDGAQLFSTNCAVCHRGGPPATWTTNRSADQLTSTISSGAGPMPGFARSMTAADIAAIVHFIQGPPPSTATPAPTTPAGGGTVMTGDCSACHGGGSAPPPGAAPGPTATGAQIFASYCVACHGATPPTTWATTRTPTQLTTTITSGLRAMPGFSASLSATQITAVVQFIAGAPATPPSPTPTATGAQLYASSCASCHGATPPATLKALSATSITSSINSGPGSMPSFTGTLTTTQITAVVQFIRGATSSTPVPTPTPSPTPAPTPSPTPAATGAQLYASNCASCHGATRPTSFRTLSATSITGSINSGPGSMPSFTGALTTTQINAIVQFVLGP
jgi:mono/diheme cytochrome c family protein